MNKRWAAVFIAGSVLPCALATAQEQQPGPRLGPYFLGYESEPAMDYGGRMVSALDVGFSDLGALVTRRRQALAAAYEVPLGILLSTVQHEVFGHGARANEFNLNPSYGIGFDLGAYTSIGKDPESMEQLLLIAGGGTEGDGIMADRLLRGLCQPKETPAATVPLMLFAKLDFSLYYLITPKPERGSGADSFEQAYEDGNDVAFYLVSRQGQRVGADPVTVWNNDYTIDFDDPLLQENWRDLRSAALWNLADPIMWASTYLYVREHLIGGKRHIAPPALRLTESFAISLGTRAAMDPQSVTRFLDLYLLMPAGDVRLYGRDLAAAEDNAYGFGADVFGLRIAEQWRINAGADYWQNPAAPEKLLDGTAWNADAEVECHIGPVVRVALKTGYKSRGFLPGTPIDSGAYFGGGLALAF